jgi:hypothetical protein
MLNLEWHRQVTLPVWAVEWATSLDPKLHSNSARVLPVLHLYVTILYYLTDPCLMLKLCICSCVCRMVTVATIARAITIRLLDMGKSCFQQVIVVSGLLLLCRRDCC